MEWDVCQIWNGKKDLLLKVNYIANVTKQSYGKMLITKGNHYMYIC